jgi:hypothetical protein
MQRILQSLAGRGPKAASPVPQRRARVARDPSPGGHPHRTRTPQGLQREDLLGAAVEVAADPALAREWKALAGQDCVDSADGADECLERVEDRPVRSPHGEKVCDVLSLDERGQDVERLLHD